MVDDRVSGTALATSLMRALHGRRDAQPILQDPWGDVLVPQSVRSRLRERALGAMDEAQRRAARTRPDSIVDDHLRSLGAYDHVILRSRYTEDALSHAVAGGVTQYVMIGAGFDSFVLRRPLYASALSVFEVDHPATQRFKLRRFAECGLSPGGPVFFVAGDLSREDLGSVLARAAFRGEQRSLFSWLGVTPYLSREANLACLGAIARCAAPGSELVFTYVDALMFDPARATPEFTALRSAVAAQAEPFVCGFDPAEIEALLASQGLTLVEDLAGPALAARYAVAGVGGLRGSAASHIVHARVGLGGPGGASGRPRGPAPTPRLPVA